MDFFVSFAVILLFIFGSSLGESPIDNICLDRNCVKTSELILQNMDKTKDPCDNFYQFACGNFMKYQHIPDDEEMFNTFSSLIDLHNKNLTTLVSKYGKEIYKKLGHTYRLCMDINSHETIGLTYIKLLLNDFGNWPVLYGTDWKEQNFDWKNITLYLMKTGYKADYLLDLSIAVDPIKLPKTYSISLDQCVLDLPREYLVMNQSSTIITAYFEYMVDLAVMFGADRNIATSEFQEVLELQRSLAFISLSREQRRYKQKIYDRTSIKTLQNLIPNIDWLQYVNDRIYPNIVSDSEIINVNLAYLNDFIPTMNHTSKRIIANYIMWRVVSESALFLNEKIRDRRHQLTKVITGQTDRKERQMECIDIINNYLPLYMEGIHYANVDSARKAVKLDFFSKSINVLYAIRDFKESYTKKFTSNNTIKFINKMKTVIVNRLDDVYYNFDLRSYLNIEKVIHEIYENLYINKQNSNNYLRLILDISLHRKQFNIQLFGKTFDILNIKLLEKQSYSNNVFYPLVDYLEVAPKFFEGLYSTFNSDAMYINSALLQTNLAQIITHVFDDEGIQYTENGTLTEIWNTNIKEDIMNDMHDLIVMYNNFTVPELDDNIKINGYATQGQNYADFYGVLWSYLTFDFYSYQNKQKKLPALDYDHTQLFWILYANQYCTKYNKESLSNVISTADYSPAEFRVNGPLSQIEYFLNDFKCNQTHKMYKLK